MVCNVHVFPVLVLDIGQDHWIFLCLMSTFIEQPGMDLYWRLLAAVKMPARGLLAGFRIMARSGFGTVYQHAPTIFAQHVCLIAYSINYISYYWQWFLKWPGQNIHCFGIFSAGLLQRKFPLHSGSQAVPHSPEPSAICSSKSDIAKDTKT